MPDPTPGDEPQSTSRGDAAHRPHSQSTPHRAGSRFWLLPALTFLVGLLLGGAVVGLSTSGDADDGAAASRPTQTVTVTPGAASDRPAATVTVPGPCLDVADSTDEVLRLVNRAATAARDLDASRLSAVVRELQERQADLTRKTSACRAAASAAIVAPTSGT